MPARCRTKPPKLNQSDLGAHSVSLAGMRTTMRRVRSCTRSRCSMNSLTGCAVIARKLHRSHSTCMTPWVRRLLIANIVIFGLQFFVPAVTYWLELVPADLLTRPWTLVTYMFLHDPRNITHILFNMYSLYLFGPRVEERLTSPHFILLYMLAGIGGGLLSFLTPNTAIIGAS